MPICDFCSSPNVAWDYPAKDFIADVLMDSLARKVTIGQSVGGWAACNHCHSLIEAGQRSALALHSAANFEQMYDSHLDAAGREELLKTFHKIHSQFFDSRNGPARRAQRRPADAA